MYFAFLGEAGAECVGEKMKKKKPMASRPASINVIEFVRRSEREMAMAASRFEVRPLRYHEDEDVRIRPSQFLETLLGGV